MTEPRFKSLLVLGGARSGKSRYAQGLVEASGLACVLIATARGGDAEMEQRIKTHKAARGPHWLTLEAETELTELLAAEAAQHRAILVDCLTLWLSNLMLGGHDIERACDSLAQCVPRLAGPVVFVSNEVGTGLVPENPLGRAFRDAQGRLNQKMTAACEAAVLVVAGLPLKLKPGEAALRL